MPIGESSQLGPKRKWRESSGSGSYDGPVWAVEKSRIGFPHPLPKLPVQLMPIVGDKQQLATWKDCQDEVRPILDEERLDYTEIGVYMRKGAKDIHASPTLLITLKSDLDIQPAKSALVTIGHMLHEKGVKGLRVEIVDPEADLEEGIYPINNDHPLVKLWPRKIKDLVLDILRDVPFSELGVYKYGYTSQAAVPTITITVKEETYSVREELKSAIVQVCASNGVPGMRVAVIIDEAKMGDLPDAGADGYWAGLQSHVKQPGMGHSIGIGSTDGGSLGGYIELVDRQTSSRRPAFLTCWHVLRPGDGDILLPVYDAGNTPYGQWPQLTSNPSHVTSPARRDIHHQNFKIRERLDEKDAILAHLLFKEEMNSLSVREEGSLHGRRKDRETDEARINVNLQLLRNKEEMFGQGKIASGYRTANGHALDWAIGEPLPERIGTNQLPSQEDLRKTAAGSFRFYLSSETKVRAIEPNTQYFEQSFFKTGSRTGLTTGYYNDIEPTVKVTLPGGEVRTTSEHTIVGRRTASGRFSERGDSGSWILNGDGLLVGLLWGGTQSVSYFTPIQLVIDDIEARTGMKVELPQ